MTDTRSIEQSVEVQGTVEQAWRAIATGPGVSSWYVPHVIEEKTGGSASASFGPGLEVAGRVVTWEPPHRVVFDGGEENVQGLTFEWRVEPKDEDTVTIHLSNGGYPLGEESDAHYQAMERGWGIFLYNLTVHMKHFQGQTAVAVLPMATWESSPDEAWSRLTEKLGIDVQPERGSRISACPAEGLTLAGTVLDVNPHRISVLVEEPAPGTAFIAAEGRGDQTTVSVWSYLYGNEGKIAAERDDPLWRVWFEKAEQ